MVSCLGCRRRRQGDDVSCGEAYEEMEEVSVDIIGYGMSVVAKDMVPSCSSRRISMSRRQTSVSLGQPTAECPLLCVLLFTGASLGTRRRRHGDNASCGVAHDGDQRVGVYDAISLFGQPTTECQFSCVLPKTLV